VRALISKVLTGSMIASAHLAISACGPREEEEMQVFIHPCGKREAIPRNAVKAPCAACAALFTVIA